MPLQQVALCPLLCPRGTYTKSMNNQPMIYVVNAGDYYESDDICCLFAHEADAHDYAAQLEEHYDWAEVTPQTVHQGPLVVA